MQAEHFCGVKKIGIITGCFASLLMITCTKDRVFAPPAAPSALCLDTIAPNVILINEFMAKGSGFYNELNPVDGDNDWLELYNNSCDTIFFNGNWFVTDDILDSTKFSFPDTVLMPGQFLTLQCDGQDITMTQIHTNFSLSSNGEDLMIFYRNTQGNLLTINRYSFGVQASGVAMARFPDASANWITTTNPTPGGHNMQ